MCRPATCKTCGKATWKGCGNHVDQVMRGIPKSQQCAGHPDQPGLIGRLFGR